MFFDADGGVQRRQIKEALVAPSPRIERLELRMQLGGAELETVVIDICLPVRHR